MKQVLIKKGVAITDDVPIPSIDDDSILVKVHYSSISAGTEMSSLSSSAKNPINKLIEQPAKILKIGTAIKKNGVTGIIEKLFHGNDVGNIAGYSASGVVLAVGKKISNVQIGDRVACAGAGIANHAEYISVPTNLYSRVPENVEIADASTVALGSIALQGIRRADPKIGENVAVLGLGILGQITVQILKANGCRVIGTDLDDSRIKRAMDLGLDAGFNPQVSNIIQAASDFSNGYGVDTVIITTSTISSEPLAQAFQMCRKKGKVVLVGVVGMALSREDMYKKELDFLISTSYGPGRYDDDYEKRGILYPYAYVRWTETRNMDEYLRLISQKKISITPLIDKIFHINEASQAYLSLSEANQKPLIVLLKYADSDNTIIKKNIYLENNSIEKKGIINVGIIGAGTFSKSTHLPNLLRLKKLYKIYAIASKTGTNAKSIARQFKAVYATTDYEEILKDNNVDAVIIATRHNLHAKVAIDAIRHGKAVLLEKPMALNEVELFELEKVARDAKQPFLVGYNRRFSRYAIEAKKHIAKRRNPLIIQYRMNAGFIPRDHWVQTAEGGGRIIGEACHIIDLFSFLTDSVVQAVSIDRAQPNTSKYRAEDNAIITLTYQDGSVCTLTYTSLGSPMCSKEYCEIFFDGNTIVIDDYKKISGFGVRVSKIQSNIPDKGQLEELVEFSKAINGKIPAPISLSSLISTSQITLKCATDQ